MPTPTVGRTTRVPRRWSSDHRRGRHAGERTRTRSRPAPTFKKTFGFAPMCAFVDHGEHGTGEPLVPDLRLGAPSPHDSADHIRAQTRHLPSCLGSSAASCCCAPTPGPAPSATASHLGGSPHRRALDLQAAHDSPTNVEGRVIREDRWSPGAHTAIVTPRPLVCVTSRPELAGRPGGTLLVGESARSKSV
jgi:hypothetical protein